MQRADETIKIYHNAHFWCNERLAWRGPQATLVVHGDHIASLSEGPPPEALAAARANRVIDLDGAYVIPGLINTHCHLTLNNPAVVMGVADFLRLRRADPSAQWQKSVDDCLARGIHTVRDAWAGDLAALDQVASLAPLRLRRSVVVGPLGAAFTPRRTLGRRLIEKLAGIASLPYTDPRCGMVVFGRDAGPTAARDAVRRAVEERGAHCIKVYEQREHMLSYRPGAPLMSEAELQAVVEAAHALGVPVTAHVVSVESFRRCLAARVDTFAHLPRDAALSDADITRFVDQRTIIEPTLSLLLGYAWPFDPQVRTCPDAATIAALRDALLAPWIDLSWNPELAPIAHNGARRLRAGHTRIFGLLPARRVFTYYGAIATHGLANLRRIAAAGGRIACANDGGVPPLLPASLDVEYRLLNTLLPEYFYGARLLRAATHESAAAIGLSEDLGDLQPGKRADMVFYMQDPCAHPELLGTPTHHPLSSAG